MGFSLLVVHISGAGCFRLEESLLQATGGRRVQTRKGSILDSQRIADHKQPPAAAVDLVNMEPFVDDERGTNELFQQRWNICLRLSTGRTIERAPDDAHGA